MALSSKRIKAMGCLSMLVVFVVIPLVYAMFSFDYLPVRFFDSSDWKQADYWSGIRIEMIEHLRWSGKLDGLSEAEVVELLGPETETTYFQEYDFVYSLGPERGFLSIDSEWLVIDFDDNGEVSRYQIVRD
ncbi:hypothetical protein ACRAQ7_12210 [Erythrobacter sp. W53]|uniref:hypothetical protein n=1 Tax=Erythrobacter sp. W53 TaxID=3425947 RepID=UPI003D768E94